jgi:hypothetical protein
MVDKELINLSKFVNYQLDVMKVSKHEALKLMHQELRKVEVKIKITQQLVIAHSKFDDAR